MSGKSSQFTIFAGWFVAGLCAALTGSACAREESRAVRYESLSREVKQTLDDERGEHPIIGIQSVLYDDTEFFRCTVKLKRGERYVRIDPGGRLLSVEDIREVEVADIHKSGNDWHREREDRERVRAEYWRRVDEKVRATVKDPERVLWDDLPPRVQALFLRVSYGAKVDYIIRYRDGGRVIYQTNIPDGPGRRHMVQATFDGAIIGEGAFTEDGRPIQGDYKVRTTEWEELPTGVKYTLEHDYRGARISHVDFSTYRGERQYKLYNITIDEPRHDRFLVITEDGDVISDIVGRDY